MNLQEMESIAQAFKDRVKGREELLYTMPNISFREGIVNGGLCIFDGPGDKAEKVASLLLEGNGEIFLARLYIGLNSYEFIDNPQLCIELINRFVNTPLNQIG